MRKIVGYFATIDESERAIKNIERIGIKPYDIKIQGTNDFDPIKKNIGLPVNIIPGTTGLFSANGYNLTPLISVSAGETNQEYLGSYYGKVILEVTADEDDLTSIGVIFRNNGAMDVKSL